MALQPALYAGYEMFNPILPATLFLAAATFAAGFTVFRCGHARGWTQSARRRRLVLRSKGDIY
jgi:hypothetical protein